MTGFPEVNLDLTKLTLEQRLAALESDSQHYAKKLDALEAKIATPHDRLTALEKAWDNDNTWLLVVMYVIDTIQAKQRAVNEALLAWTEMVNPGPLTLKDALHDALK